MANANQNEFSIELCDDILDHIPAVPEMKLVCYNAKASVYNDSVKEMIQRYIDMKKHAAELLTLAVLADATFNRLAARFKHNYDTKIIAEMVKVKSMLRKYNKERKAHLDSACKLYEYLSGMGIRMDLFFPSFFHF